VRFLLVLICVVVLAFPNESHSGARFADVGFEVSGAVGVLPPNQYQQGVDIDDADARPWVYGFGAAAVLPLGEYFRASIGSGYFRSQSREGHFIPPSEDPWLPYSADYLFESVPLTGGVDFLLTESITPAVTLGVTLETHFLTVTRRVHEQSGYDGSASTTITGLSMDLGIEWPMNQRIFLGFGGGYRFAEGEEPNIDKFPPPGEQIYPLDLGGAFATLLIRVYPWQRVSKD
jgi:hypothetical protein